jgi:exo-beta-1,3-glucanase (GH17 family)
VKLHSHSRRLWQVHGFLVAGFLCAALSISGCAHGVQPSDDERTPTRPDESSQPLRGMTVGLPIVLAATPTQTITVTPVPARTPTLSAVQDPRQGAASVTRTPSLAARITPEPAGTVASLQISPARSITDTLASLCWVGFAPTNQDPENGISPSDESLREDLQVLRTAGFDGLVTYGSEDRVYRFARELGYKAMILGVWDPTSEAELGIAEAAGKDAFVVGFAVGNEGLHRRYEIDDLMAAMARLRRSTGKPATTTEASPEYGREPGLARLGDWVFPNVHPYFQHKTDPVEAVRWTEQTFDQFTKRAPGRIVVFKEVGLPTAGDKDVDEQNQADYYRLLDDTAVRFVYFEAFDQPWKNSLPVEPHWGLFRSDRSPKPVVKNVCGAPR